MNNSPMKFLCDQMLSRLGRWLRAAGYDTVIIADSTPDEIIYQQAQQEKRLVITRDRGFLGSTSDPTVVVLQSETVKGCAEELSQRVPIHWLLAPFSRCLLCNGELRVI